MTPKHTWLAATAVVALLALIGGWLRPLPPEARIARKTASAWALPAPTDLERSSAAQFAATAALKWVGDDTAGSAGSGAAPWTLLGLVRGPDLAVLVKSGSDPVIKRVKAGDTLPDGSRLAEIHPDAVVVEKEGCRARRPLYQHTQEQSDDGCGTAQDQ